MINALKIKEVYNNRAKGYDKILKRLRYHARLQSILRTINLDIKNNSRILDIGCGTGLATEVLIKRFPDAEILGLDYSEEMLHLYNNKFPDIQTIVGDFNSGREFSLFPEGKSFTLRPGYFDLIISTGAVSEYGEKNKAIPFVHKLLSKNGIFVNVGIEKNVMSFITGRIWHYKPMGRRNLINACRQFGFSNVDIIKIKWNHFPSNITKFVVRARK